MVAKVSRQLDITAEGVTAADILIILLFGQVSNEVSNVRNISFQGTENLIPLDKSVYYY